MLGKQAVVMQRTLGWRHSDHIYIDMANRVLCICCPVNKAPHDVPPAVIHSPQIVERRQGNKCAVNVTDLTRCWRCCCWSLLLPLQVRNALVSERERLFAKLKEVPFLEPYPSHANFILAKVWHGAPAAQGCSAPFAGIKLSQVRCALLSSSHSHAVWGSATGSWRSLSLLALCCSDRTQRVCHRHSPVYLVALT